MKIRKPTKSIKIEMTDEQLLKMNKLFLYVEKHPAQGAIIGQIKDDGVFTVNFWTPEALEAAAKKMILFRDTIMPAKGT